MTVRELINILLDYDADETIDFLDKDEEPMEIIVKSFYNDLPFLQFGIKGDEED